MRARPQRLLALAALGGVLATASVGAAGTGQGDRSSKALADALAKAKATAPNAPRVRGAVPADRYEPAGGCYVVKSESTGKYVGRAGTAFAATAGRDAAEPFLFQAYDLGKYLLFASKKDFLATQGGTLPGASGPAKAALGYVKGTGDENLDPARDPLVGAVTTAAGAADAATLPARQATRSDAIVAAAKPSADAEWVLEAGPAGSFTLRLPVDDGEPENPGPLDPAIYGTLTAGDAGALAVAKGTSNAKAARFALELASGCAAYPEIELNVDGAVPTADTAYEATQGYVDAHLHMMAFEFIGGRSRCGRPWHPYGVQYALVDCPDHEPGGRGAVLEQVLSGSDPAGAHDTTGWPSFGYWPKYSSLTHEQVYYRWLERAWLGGVRMFTNLLVDNNVLCEIYPYKKNSCNEMDGVRLQAQRLRELERYIDAQSGGPGRGWFRIVTDPFEARRVVNAGKLAVVMGIEVSVPFDCGEHLNTVPHCDQAKIDARLDEVYALGVRQMELTNKFDNALTGVTGDSGLQGPVVNAGNKYETGHNWMMGTCDDPANNRADKLQPNIADGYEGNAPPGEVGRDAIFAGVLEVFGETGAAPVYPPGPHCNKIGLSDLGKSAIDGLIKRGMIFDPDHMSAKAREQAMDYVGSRGYSGLVSSHSWSDDPTYRRILQLGGVVTPHGGSAASFVGKWRKQRAWAEDTGYLIGIGFGSDVNGFSTQGAPRNPAPGAGVQYPFTALGGVRVDKQVSGTKTFDFNTSGVDHYGLYPDWVEDVRIQAGADGAQFMADLANGVEAYLQMWERAIGVQPASCLTRSDVKALRKGMSPEEVLAAVGQPKSRVDAAYTYCGPDGTLTVGFDAAGRLRSIG